MKQLVRFAMAEAAPTGAEVLRAQGLPAEGTGLAPRLAACSTRRSASSTGWPSRAL